MCGIRRIFKYNCRSSRDIDILTHTFNISDIPIAGGSCVETGAPLCTHLVVEERSIKTIPFETQSKLHLVKSEVSRNSEKCYYFTRVCLFVCQRWILIGKFKHENCTKIP